MSEPENNRRISDNSRVARFVENPYARLVHQVISWTSPPALGLFVFFALHYAEGFERQLNKATDAINQLTAEISGKFGGYDARLVGDEARISRLEDVTDGYRRKLK